MSKYPFNHTQSVSVRIFSTKFRYNLAEWINHSCGHVQAGESLNRHKDWTFLFLKRGCLLLDGLLSAAPMLFATLNSAWRLVLRVSWTCLILTTLAIPALESSDPCWHKTTDCPGHKHAVAQHTNYNYNEQFILYLCASLSLSVFLYLCVSLSFCLSICLSISISLLL